MTTISLGSGKALPERCSLCNNLQRLDRNGRPWRFETIISKLEASVDSGCQFCMFLLSSIDHFIPPQWETQERARTYVYEYEADLPFEGLLVCIDCYRADGVREQFAVDFFTLRPATCPWTSIGVGSEICGDTSSEAAFAKISQWLRECTHNHTCYNGNRLTPLPKRVVYVGDSDGNQLRLYETENEPAKYMCLSHCWGTTQVTKTTTASLRQYKNNIPWADLSTTFRHAITVTRKLGIQYIWIDSLCIIQDSEEDWRIESSKMASIYENSYLTVAATKSGGGTGGCFSTASPEYKAVELICDDDDGITYPVYVRRNLHDNYNVGPGNNPLLKRGWVFQERLLSPRVLHFGMQEVLWECMEAAECECSYVKNKKELQLSSVSEYLLRQMLGKISHGIKLASQSSQVLRGRWHEIVAEYSSLDLTFQKDIFPALSGVAKQMQRVRGSKYLAGLWEDNLIEDLLWGTFSLSADRPSKWRAPTWSWASVNGRIQYNSDSSEDKRIFARILDVQCVPLAPDSTAELASATLVVSGYMATASLCLNRRLDATGVYRYGIEADDGEDYDFKSDYTFPEGSVDKREVLYCLWMRRKGSDNPYWHCDCLVLKCVDGADQVYERVGLAWLAKHHLSPLVGDDSLSFVPKAELVTVRIR
ncbi:heterokaryon incompatibility protein-domain-containing protein [Nemania abortiva]|nr:heterokaryon incompatibility protein-domain-containing protein [Nemania abortiva]